MSRRKTPKLIPKSGSTVVPSRGRRVVAVPAVTPRARERILDGPINPEVLLISALITTGDLEPPANEGINAEHFHTHRDEWIWIEDYVANYRKAPDSHSFHMAFPYFPLVETTDVEYATDEVKRSSLRFALSTALRPVAESLADNDPDEALDRLRASVMGIERHRSSGANLNVLDDHEFMLHEARKRMEAASSMGYSGVPFGFPSLDDRTGGMHPGDLVIWAARLGVGKTWMLCKIATEALLTGRRVCFVSLEQPRAQIAFRIHTLLGREFGYNLRHRDLMTGTNYDLDYYESFLMDLPSKVSGELIISDPTRGRVSPFTLATLMERHEPDLMIIDYLTLMQHEGEDWRGMRKLSADTKLVGGQYGVPILAAAQINRMGEGGTKPPGTSTLAESDGIGQDADVIVTMKKSSESVIQLLLAKNRSGQDGQTFWSCYQPNVGRIEEVSGDEARTLMATDSVD